MIDKKSLSAPFIISMLCAFGVHSEVAPATKSKALIGMKEKFPITTYQYQNKILCIQTETIRHSIYFKSIPFSPESVSPQENSHVICSILNENKTIRVVVFDDCGVYYTKRNSNGLWTDLKELHIEEFDGHAGAQPRQITNLSCTDDHIEFWVTNNNYRGHSLEYFIPISAL